MDTLPMILAAATMLLIVVLATRWVRMPPPPAEVDLTPDAFVRWLQACRPPLPLFLSMTEAEQERLAELGREHTQDVCIGIGYAVANPAAASASIDPANPESEIDLLKQVAQAVASKLARNAAPTPGPTMGGLGGRGRRNGTVRP